MQYINLNFIEHTDVDINLLVANCRNFEQYLNTVSSHSLVPQACMPIRVTSHSATLIGHILINKSPFVSKRGIWLSDISNLFTTFITPICILNLNGITFYPVFLLFLKSCYCYLSRRNSWRVQNQAWKNVASEFHKTTMFHVVIFILQTVFLPFLYKESSFCNSGNHRFRWTFYIN